MMGSAGRESLVVVGTITRTHGIRGEVYVRADSDNPDRFVPPARFRTDHARFPLLVLRQARQGPHGLIAEFAGHHQHGTRHRSMWTRVDDRRTGSPSAGGRRILADQLVGLDVRVGVDVIGRISEVVLGPQDRLVVERDDGLVGEVPFVGDLVPEVDLDEGWVRIEPPEGLFSPR